MSSTTATPSLIPAPSTLALDTQQLPDVAVEIARLLLQAFVGITEITNSTTAVNLDPDVGRTPDPQRDAIVGGVAHYYH